MKHISIVLPVYNEEENIEFVYSEINRQMNEVPYDYEILFVDDGSKDATPLLLGQLAKRDARVKVLILSTNYGFQIALTCGLDHAQGEAVITMDADMQHPPQMLPLLLKKWEEGYEIVQTIRIDTEGVSWLKRLTSRWFYRLINLMSNVQIPEGGSDFRLLDRKVVESLRLFRERARFLRGMVSAIGYRQTFVEFVALPRHAGKSKFSFNRMLRFALDGITAYSRLPLRFAFYTGLLFGLISFGLGFHVVYIRLFTNEAVPGWATLAASLALFGGLQLIGLGIIGEYVGRIFEEVKRRPLYLVRTYLNIAELDGFGQKNRQGSREMAKSGEYKF